MKPPTANFIALALGASLALGCHHQKEPEGPAEEAGEKIDEGAEKAKDKAEDAAEDAEDAADDAAEDAEDSAN